MNDIKDSDRELALAARPWSEPLPVEIASRRQRDGRLWLVLARRAGDPWPVLDIYPGARLDRLSLVEDLDVERTR